MRQISVAIALLALLLSGCATSLLTPDVPLDLRPGQGTVEEQLLLRGEGFQRFRCTKDDQGYYWKFLESEATLVERDLAGLMTGTQVGQLRAGQAQTFEHQDGSKVLSVKIERHTKGMTKADIPWLRMKAKSASVGSRAFDSVQYILRVQTQGGMPYIPCDAANLDMIHDSPFKATYIFWK